MTVAQQSTAARLISAKGQAVSIAWDEGGDYNTATGTVGGATSETVTTTAVVLPLSPYRKAGNSMIAPGDENLLIGATGIPMPPAGAVVTLADGSKRAIVAIEELAPAGLPIMYDAVARGYQ